MAAVLIAPTSAASGAINKPVIDWMEATASRAVGVSASHGSRMISDAIVLEPS